MNTPSGQKKINFLPSKKTCEFTGQPTILEVAILYDLPLNHSCGGMGSCTTCRVIIQKGAERLPPPEEVEKEHALMRGFMPNERLACQVTAIDGLEIEIPD